MPTRRPQVAERQVAAPPGELLTGLLLRAGLAAGRGGLPRPVPAGGGFEIAVPGRPAWRLTLRAEGDGSRVRLEAPPPPWPWSIGWAERTLDRLLGG